MRRMACNTLGRYAAATRKVKDFVYKTIVTLSSSAWSTESHRLQLRAGKTWDRPCMRGRARTRTFHTRSSCCSDAGRHLCGSENSQTLIPVKFCTCIDRLCSLLPYIHEQSRPCRSVPPEHRSQSRAVENQWKHTLLYSPRARLSVIFEWNGDEAAEYQPRQPRQVNIQASNQWINHRGRGLSACDGLRTGLNGQLNGWLRVEAVEGLLHAPLYYKGETSSRSLQCPLCSALGRNPPCGARPPVDLSRTP